MFANSKSIFLAAAFLAISIPTMSSAADMIQYGQDRAPSQKTYYRSSYDVQRETCSNNIVSYRAPYERHTELVTLCHAPLRWNLGPSSATTWSP